MAIPIYLVAMTALTGGGGDFAIADHLYAWQGDAWQMRQHWLTASWIHEGGKRLSWLLWLGTAAFTCVIWRRPAWREWRKPLLALLASVLLSTSLVATIKQALPMACPWDLQRYGGTHAFVGLFEAWPTGWAPLHCFPAAHASSAFAWIALYYLLIQLAPRWRWSGLGAGLLMGATFAISQELRGAHFLSHDLTTLMICWTVSLLINAAGHRRVRA